MSEPTSLHLSTSDAERPVTPTLLILRGLTLGGWIVAEGILLLSVFGLAFASLQA